VDMDHAPFALLPPPPFKKKPMTPQALFAHTLSRPPRPGCWLVPTDHHAALVIARNVGSLRRAGWNCGMTAESDVLELADKQQFRSRAARLGLLEHLPIHYSSLDQCTFPCMLKASDGEFGKGVHIVKSKEEAMAIMEVEEGLRRGLGGAQAADAQDRRLAEPQVDKAPLEFNRLGRWLLQELILGPTEFATTVLWQDGKIIDLICTQYTYARGEYVWPKVKEHTSARRTFDRVPSAHLDVMRRLLDGFDGVANFNYKLRPDGRLCLFEVNPRLGGDLACDTPPSCARALWERMEGSLPPREEASLAHDELLLDVEEGLERAAWPPPGTGLHWEPLVTAAATAPAAIGQSPSNLVSAVA
jgi:hypothetical protein